MDTSLNDILVYSLWAVAALTVVFIGFFLMRTLLELILSVIRLKDRITRYLH